MYVCRRDHLCIPDWPRVCDSLAYTSLAVGYTAIYTEDCLEKKL